MLHGHHTKVVAIGANYQKTAGNKASVESAVKMVLRKRNVKGSPLAFILNRLMKQAEALYKDWPLAA